MINLGIASISGYNSACWFLQSIQIFLGRPITKLIYGMNTWKVSVWTVSCNHPLASWLSLHPPEMYESQLLNIYVQAILSRFTDALRAWQQFKCGLHWNAFKRHVTTSTFLGPTVKLIHACILNCQATFTFYGSTSFQNYIRWEWTLKPWF